MILLRVNGSINCPILACLVVGIFSFSLCVGVAQLVSWFLLEWIAPCIAVHLVCPSEERNLEDSSVAIWLTPWRALKFNWPWCDLFLLLSWMFSVWVSFKILSWLQWKIKCTTDALQCTMGLHSYKPILN